MAIQWPTTLPELPLHSAYSRIRQSGVLRDDGNTGFINVRRRFTAVSKAHTISTVMNKAQLAIFFSFFENDIGAGTLSFSYVNPMYPDGNMTVRMMTSSPPYDVSWDADTLDYMVNFTLEELPGTITVMTFPENKVTSQGEDKITTDGYQKVTDRGVV